MQERSEYEIFVQYDKIVNSKRELFDTTESISINRNLKDKSNKAIFVMSNKGNIYVSKYSETGVFHHSSLVAGEEIAAGEIIIEKGIIKMINNKSGHYLPTIEINKKNLLDELTYRDYFIYGINKIENIIFKSDF